MTTSIRADFADKIWRGEVTPGANQASTGGRRLTINEMKDAMVELYDRSNEQDFSVFDEMFAPEFVSYGGAGFQDLHGAEEFRQLYIQFVSSMPDLNFRVENVVAEGNLCGVRGTLSGTHKGNFMGFAPPTGKRVTWTGTAIFRFNDNGLMDARWQEWDGLSVMQQMGVIPAPGENGAPPPTPIPPYIVGGEYSSPRENKAITQRLIEELWNQGKIKAADEIFHPLATSPSEPQLPPGPDGFKGIRRMIQVGMPDYRIEEIKVMLADGDQVLAWFTQTGTQTGEFMGIPPSGKKATWGEMLILRFAGGKVIESWHNLDMLGMFQQLGVGGTPSAGA